MRETHDMFDVDDEFTAITTRQDKDEEVCTTSEDELCITNTTGEGEEEVRNMSDNATIDNKFTTCTTTEDNITIKEAEDLEQIVPTSNNYYDNIDHKILQT